jgi:hypothetical protein
MGGAVVELFSLAVDEFVDSVCSEFVGGVETGYLAN